MLPRKAGKARLLLIWMACMGAILRVGAVVCSAQGAVAPNADAAPETTQFRSGLSEISENWLEHDGDNPAWAARNLNEAGWKPVDDVEDMGAATVGWKWFRKRVVLGPDHSEVRLLISGGDGTYELFVNGSRVDGAGIGSPLRVTRPKERVFALEDDQGDFEIAIRTFITPEYSQHRLPVFLYVTIGGTAAIRYEHRALESERLYEAVPSIGINLLVILGGLWTLALFFNQRRQRDYLFLGIYLTLYGLSIGLWIASRTGVLPISANVLLADPLSYLFSIAQIEFTFSFTRRRVYRWLRIYEIALLVAPLLVIPCWTGHFAAGAYLLVEAALLAPVALMMPAFLLAWYLKGNREAGLILPSLLPSAIEALYDLGSVSIYLGWGNLDFLDNSIYVGPVPVSPGDLAGLLFLLAIGVVMFFRFTRVSREQARAAAELEAAREIQQRLVPASLPPVAGWRVEAAYLPAQEVGGDFYQVMGLADGSTLVVLGDVSGKGLKAAMTGTLAIGALRTLAAEALGPAELLERLNRQMVQAQDGGFVTCVAARVSEDGSLTIANAGHLAPYWNGREVAVEPSLPLGIDARAAYAEAAIQVDAGDRVTILSDGVVEAQNPGGELLGFERTRELSMRTAAEIAEEAQLFGQSDDITVLTLVAEATAAGEREETAGRAMAGSGS